MVQPDLHTTTEGCRAHFHIFYYSDYLNSGFTLKKKDTSFSNLTTGSGIQLNERLGTCSGAHSSGFVGSDYQNEQMKQMNEDFLTSPH